MNYYEHHLRDYDAATSHLSWDEDLAYTRLLRWYYRKEKPIPADVKEACRQVRATSKVQRDAVAAVLGEFFELRPDGWHKDTCDEAIAKYKAGEPEREAKKINEDTRLARHRAERAELFRIINGAGIHRPWNAPIAELRELAKRLQERSAATAEPESCNGDETKSATPATGTATPATATQTPDTIPQTPDTRHHDVAKDTRSAQPDGVPPDEQPDRRVSMVGAVCIALKAAGVGRVNPGHPRLAALLADGAGVDAFVGAAPQALKPGISDPFAYVLGAVEGQMAEARQLAARGAAATPATPRNGHSGSSARAARMAEAVPALVNGHAPGDFIEAEARDVTPRRVG